MKRNAINQDFITVWYAIIWCPLCMNSE